jgi:hypothetical protein
MPTSQEEKTSQEEFEARKLAEENALQESILSSGISDDEADKLIEELAEKHETERKMNMVFPDLDAYRDYKAAASFVPVQRPKTTDSETVGAESHVSATNDAPPEIVEVALPEQSSDIDPKTIEYDEADQLRREIEEDKAKLIMSLNKYDEMNKNLTEPLIPQPASSTISAETKKGMPERMTVADRVRAAMASGQVFDKKTFQNIASDEKKSEEDRAWAKAEVEEIKRKEQKQKQKEATVLVPAPVQQESEQPKKNPSAIEGILESIHLGNADGISMETLKRYTQSNPEIAAYYETRCMTEESKSIKPEESAEKKTNIGLTGERVLSAIKEGAGATVPAETLKKYSHLPEVAEFMKTQATQNGPSSFDATLKFIQQGKGEVIPIEMLERHAGSNPEIAAYYETRAKAEAEKAAQVEAAARPEQAKDQNWNPDAVARHIALHRQYRVQAAQGLAIPEAAKNQKDEDFYRQEYIKMGGDPAALEQIISSFDADVIETTRLYQRAQEEWAKVGKPYDTIVPVDNFYYMKHENGPEIRFDTLAEAEAYVSLAGKEALAVSPNETSPDVMHQVSPGIYSASAVAGLEAFGHNPLEPNPEKNVFSGLGVLSDTPPSSDENVEEPLIVGNPLGETQFVPKEDLQLDLQGEAMRNLIDNTPEAHNLADYKPDFVMVGGLERVPPEASKESSENKNYPVVPYTPFEVTTTGGEAKKEISPEISEKFAKQFNIPAEQLKSVEGFERLSEGQQMLVLERMKSVAFDDINTEKVSRYRARIDELSKSSSWWDKLKSVGMKATKQFQLGRMKDEVSAEWLKGGDVDAAAMKKDALEGLVAQALQTKEFGVFEHDGKLSTAFISPKDFGENLDEATKTQILDFNEVANLYANKAFVENDEAGKAELKQKFESAARDMTRLLAGKDEGKWSGDNAAEWRTKLEGAVQMSRFFQDNPEVDKELATAGRNIGAAVGFKNHLAEKSFISAGSMGARYFGISVLGLAAIPTVIVSAAGIGGVMGWRRAKQDLSENDLLAAMGERDKSDDKAHEKDPGSNVKDRAKNVVEGGVLVTKLENLLKEYESASETEMVESSARDANGRLRFQDTPNKEGKHVVMEQVSKKESLRRALEARVAYTTRKMEEQLIDLGTARSDRTERMSALALTLGKAQAELGFADEGINALETRLDNILDIREEKIEANRKTHLVKQAVRGATMGAAFSGAGLLIGGMLPGHAQAGSFGGGASEENVKAVGDALREEGAQGLPAEITAPQQEALVKGFTEYMIADAAGKKLIAESLGMTTQQMDAKIAGILSHAAPEAIKAPEGIIPPELPVSFEDDAVATVDYKVKTGDNLSHIMKAHLSIFKDLTPTQQENVIQNFIHGLSTQEMKDIGITDVDQIAAGQHIQVDRLNEILAAKRINGQDLIEHAQQLGTAKHQADGPTWVRSSFTDTPAAVSPAEVVSIGGEGIREVALSPLSSEDAAAIEQALGRQLSGSESHVLHSLKGLAPLAESDAEQQTLGAALDHLQKEMQGAGRSLTTVEMQRILSEHNGLDTKIKFFEAVVSPTSPAVAENVPTSLDYTQSQWQSLADSARPAVAEHLAKDYLREDTNSIFGKDVFGNPAKEWVILRERSAAEVFEFNEDYPTNDASILSIREYAETEGFTEVNGYAPAPDETVEHFLERVHALRVFEDGPRPETR